MRLGERRLRLHALATTSPMLIGTVHTKERDLLDSVAAGRGREAGVRVTCFEPPCETWRCCEREMQTAAVRQVSSRPSLNLGTQKGSRTDCGRPRTSGGSSTWTLAISLNRGNNSVTMLRPGSTQSEQGL